MLQCKNIETMRVIATKLKIWPSNNNFTPKIFPSLSFLNTWIWFIKNNQIPTKIRSKKTSALKTSIIDEIDWIWESSHSAAIKTAPQIPKFLQISNTCLIWSSESSRNFFKIFKLGKKKLMCYRLGKDIDYQYPSND